MKRICLYCGKEFETHTRSKCCCKEHELKRRNIEKFPDGSDYVECKICGYRGSDLHLHIMRVHYMKVIDYCTSYGIQEIDLQTKTIRQHNSDMQKLAIKEGRLHGWKKGDENPSRRSEVREGRKSIFSLNYEGYDGLSDAEKREKIDAIQKDLADKKKQNHNNPLTVEYYLKRGFTEEEAKAKLRDRQSTFTLQKCIQKYGEDEGKRVFRARQEKWQNTLNSKPPEEIERINKLKATSTKFICAYSKISQKLFNKIFEQIKDDYSKIFYATHGNQKNSNENMEYEVILEDGKHRYFLDFYVKDNNKVIEFDGDYWHGEKRGNQERDRIREEHLRQLGFTNIFRVKERDYLKDPDKVVAQCIEFIKR